MRTEHHCPTSLGRLDLTSFLRSSTISMVLWYIALRMASILVSRSSTAGLLPAGAMAARSQEDSASEFLMPREIIKQVAVLMQLLERD